MSAHPPHRHPAWYGSVMGTAALALALSVQSSTWGFSGLSWVAVAFLLLASALALVLLPRYVGRVTSPEKFAAELGDPVAGPMLATWPAGLLVLASAWGKVGPTLVPAGVALWIDAVLLIVGAVLAVTIGTAWAAAILRSTPGLEGVHGGWLIPPVMNLIVPLALAPLIAANPGMAPTLTLVGFAFYGIGVILFLAMLTLLIARLALRDPHAAALAPSMWIPLAPAGVVGLALLRLTQAAQQAGDDTFAMTSGAIVVSAMGIGFGLWWSVFALIELRRVRAAGGPPVHPGWWGFVFPIAAMTLSIAAVGAATALTAIEVLGAIGTVLLVGIWILVAARTVGMLRAPRA